MIRMLRAFAWLRWRMFVNSLERTGSRDLLERFSIAADTLKPIMAGVLLVPSGLALASIGAASGYALAHGGATALFGQAPRYLLMASLVEQAPRALLMAFPLASVVGPLLLPATDRINPVRILLLPIGRATLYTAQAAAALGDIWIVLLLPLVAGVPLGLVAGGAPGMALSASAAGVLMVVLGLALSSTTTGLVQLAVRDRRRGEMLALLVLVLIPIASMIPALLGEAISSAHPAAGSGGGALNVAPWMWMGLMRVASWYPSELYTTAVAAAADRAPHAWAALGGLAAEALLLHLAGIFVFNRVMDSPFSSGSRRGVRVRAVWQRRLPGLSSGASAVAFAQVRLAIRTPRGRAILMAPVALLFLYVLLMRQQFRHPALDGWTSDPGVAIAAVGAFICLVATLPIAMNQFGLDTGGLTRVLLSPLGDGEYLAGKAVGNAMVAAVPAGFLVAASWAAAPGVRAPASWVMLGTGLLAVSLLVAPIAAMLSAAFPRKADLNSIGRQSNAHGLAGFLGIVAYVAAGLATLGIAAAASHWLASPAARVGALLMWCGVSAVICMLLFRPARRIFAARRDNLAML
ncbi:MAG: hypothetical protein ABI603_12405 [Acidobacteriota bacterium]